MFVLGEEVLRIVVSRNGEELGAGDYEVDLVRIGSTEDNDLQVEDPAVSEHHVEVFLFGKRAYARSPDGKPLDVNGKLVEERAELRDGEAVRIGEFAFTVRLAPPEPSEQEDTKTYKSGRVKLKGSEMLGLPSREEEEQVILRARAILVGRGASEGELNELRAKGVDWARQIVDREARAELKQVADLLETERPLDVQGVSREVRSQVRRSRLRRGLERLVALALMLAAGAVLVLRLMALIKTYR